MDEIFLEGSSKTRILYPRLDNCMATAEPARPWPTIMKSNGEESKD